MSRLVFFLIGFTVIFTLATMVVLGQSKFGKAPSGERLERIKKSPNYKDGAFQNQSYTPVMTGSAFSSFKKMMFSKKSLLTPVKEIPSVKTNLLELDRNKDVLIWFGHSSYFIQIDGKRILVDPVLSGYASPFSWSIKAFKGADVYKPEDIPDIDYLIITHDHWDHLDYKTIMKLKPRIKNIFCALGVAADLEYWGFDPKIISELDWYEKAEPINGFVVTATPARHFSGRGLKRNRTLWASYVLQTPSMKIFIGGDGGYDKHFAEIGEKFGPFDLAMLEQGQYNENWKYIHMLPEFALKAAQELKAKRLFPVHNSKFLLGPHKWSEPLTKITENNKEHKMNIVTPMIGEQVNLKDTTQTFSQWWENTK
jgi:L-ascorbate metabolism protein UlaG (beta-lactamase superfamily)